MQCATVLQFYYVIADEKVGNNIFKENTLNAIVLNLQLIYSTVTISKYLLLSYAMSYRSAILLCYN